MGWTHPDIAVPDQRRPAVPGSARGLPASALLDIQVGQAAGRFTVTDAQISPSAVARAVGLRLVASDRQRVDETSVDQLTEACLRLLGVPGSEAARLVAS